MLNLHKECERILKEAEKQHVLLRVIGGLAVNLHSPKASLLPALKREYGDLDFVTASPDDQKLRSFFESIGFKANSRFNALQGQRRMIFDSLDDSWHIDIFINEFRMCHKIKFPRLRLLEDPVTIPLAELMLTKLQIVEINAKDVKDISALLIEHPLGDEDQEMINVQHILEVTCGDWGFYTTVHDNLEKTKNLLQTVGLTGKDLEIVQSRLDELAKQMEAAPKTLAWKTRAIIGKSMQWYEEPEDAARGELKLE
jgi:hypothetical protein